jgi:nucleoside-diphosphate-sugar epimerase
LGGIVEKSRISVVTGGAGFIGSHLCEKLLERGDRVRIIDNFSSGKASNVSALRGLHPGRLEIFEADIRDRSLVEEIMAGADFVFHQAAVVSVQKSVDDPIETDSVNVGGTVKVLEAARRARVRKVVMASSTAVYGNSEELPKRENMPVQPLSPYAASKYSAEMYGAVFSTLYNLPVVCLRYFNVFGPRQDPASEYAAVVSKFIDRLLAGQPPVIRGDGEQTRDFVFVTDVVRANLLAAEGPASGVSLNIASGERYSLNSLVLILNELLGGGTEPVYAPARLGEVRHSQADVSSALAILGYQPKVSLREGLQRTIEWFRGTSK